MGAAPRIFEKAHGRDRDDAARRGRREGEDLRLGVRGRPARSTSSSRRGQAVPLLLKVQHALADKLVFSKIRDRFGGRIRFFISGSAALNRDVAEWFHAAGMLILEGYGLTETRAGSLRQPPGRATGSARSAGRCPGTEVEDRRGRRDPDQGPRRHARATTTSPRRPPRRSTDDGWLHTGDIGELDDDGFLRITDRKKDLFKTSGGKYVAPQAIEAQFKAICPYASQFVVVRRRAQLRRRADHPRPRRDRRLGRRERHGGRVVRRGRPDSDAVAGDGRRATSTSSTAELNRWETIKKFEHPRPRPHRRVGRADPDHEGQAQGRRGEQLGHDQVALLLSCS